MAVKIKELPKREERWAPGHRACAGCAAPIAIRNALKMVDGNVVCSISTGCMEVVSTIYPYTSWKCSLLHSAFENSAATISGVEAAYRALKKRGKLKDDFKFIGWGGDGGTYDIGFQSLSGAMERGHDMLFICYDNEGYMNTGIQRSSATPLGAATNTSPAGKVIPGKTQTRKDLTEIMAAHEIPYVAQAAAHNMRDFMTKVEKALSIEGAKFINILAPCNRGWRVPIEQSLEVSKVATETCFWPLYEVENGEYKLNYKPKEKRPAEDWLKMQGRFRHVFEPGREELLKAIQDDIDRKWRILLNKCGENG